MTKEDIAKVCHDVNAAFCRSLGDNSQMPWNEAPDWQKESALKGVSFIESNPDASPSASHDSWLAQKKEEGWKYGKVKNVEKKEHPCYVPYEELTVDQKAKDYIFGAIVRGLLPYLGHGVVPPAPPEKLSFNEVAARNTVVRDDGTTLIDLSSLSAPKIA